MVSVVKKLCNTAPTKFTASLIADIAPDTEVRKCTGCRHKKPLSEFRNKYSRNLKKCFDCRNKARAFRKTLTPHKPGETLTENKLRQSRANYLLGIREAHLRTNYGLTLEDVQTMLDDCGHKCGICGSYIQLTQMTLKRKSRSTSACIDHCHSTGKVRGLLCGLCNSGLGFFRDNIMALRSAINYLEHHNK